MLPAPNPSRELAASMSTAPNPYTSPDTLPAAPAASLYGPPDRWFILCLVATEYFILYLHRNLLNYVQKSLIKDLDVSDTQIGALSWAFLFAYALVQIGVGYLGDRFQRRNVLFVCLLLSSLSVAAMALVTNFWQLFALTVLLAVAQSPTVPAIASVIADCFTERNRSKAVGIYLYSYTASLILAGKLGGWFADKEWSVPLGWLGGETWHMAGWRMAMQFFGGCGIVASMVFIVLFREPKRTERSAKPHAEAADASLKAALLSVLRVRTFYAITLAFVLTSIVILVMQKWLSRHFTDSPLFKMTQEDGGLHATLWVTVGTIAGLFLGGLWGDRRSKVALSGRTSVQIVGVGIWIPALIVIGLGQTIELLAPFLLLFGLGVGLYQSNLWTTTFEVVDPAARSTAIGLLNVASGVFGAWTQPFIGWVHPKVGGLGVVFLAMTGIAVLSIGVLVYSIKRLLPGDYRRRL